MSRAKQSSGASTANNAKSASPTFSASSMSTAGNVEQPFTLTTTSSAALLAIISFAFLGGLMVGRRNPRENVPEISQSLPEWDVALQAESIASCDDAPPAIDAWPRPIARVEWRPRRVFDKGAAVREVNYPSVSSGGLQSADQAMLWRIYRESDSVFEMGVGESTKIAVFTGVPRYTGVDGSIEWLGEVRKVSPSHYRFHWADVGEIGAWSVPTDTAATLKWPFYSMGALAAESAAFDFYLVDGRFRVACLCACLLHASRHGKDPAEFRVGVHDFQRIDYYRDALLVGEVGETQIPSHIFW